MDIKERQFNRILSKYEDCLEDVQDLYANCDPSFFFYILADYFSYLMSNDDKIISRNGIRIRQFLNRIVKIVGPFFLPCKHVVENRHILENENSSLVDEGILLSKEPVIWAVNHDTGFRGDPLAAILSIPRNAYMLVGNIPQFYNSLDSIPAFINGLVLVNRRNRTSRQASIKKCEKVIEFGGDIMIFPEGVLNKSASALSLHLFPGVYRIAKEKNVKIVPVIHYRENAFSTSKKDTIHTVIDDPIDVSNMSKEEALTTLKDTFAYWKYLMMEKYGQTTREEELGDEDSNTYWENKIQNRPLARYDLKSEITYYPKEEREYYKVLDDIIHLETSPETVLLVEDAKKLVKSQIQRRI